VLGVKLFGSGKFHCLAIFNGWLLKLFNFFHYIWCDYDSWLFDCCSLLFDWFIWSDLLFLIVLVGVKMVGSIELHCLAIFTGCWLQSICFGGYWFFIKWPDFMLGVKMMGSSKFHGAEIFIWWWFQSDMYWHILWV
jgi:hypothetical protein